MAPKSLKIEKYVRKPFAVDAVEVTESNLYEAAKWCGGRVHRNTQRWGEHAGQKFIRVNVPNALSERQTMAYIGDWILSSNTGKNGFKVYTPKAFEKSFGKQVERMVETVTRMDERAAAEEEAEEQEETLPFRESIAQ
jgi:hypothetical protein